MKSEGLGMSPVDWTVSDVASYFAAVGFPEQAVAFKAQVGPWHLKQPQDGKKNATEYYDGEYTIFICLYISHSPIGNWR